MSSSTRTRNSQRKVYKTDHQQVESPWKDDELYKTTHEMHNDEEDIKELIPRQKKQKKQRKEQRNNLREGNIDTNEEERKNLEEGKSGHIYVENSVTPEEAYWIR